MAENALQLARNAGAYFREALALRVQAQIAAHGENWGEAFSMIQRSISILEASDSKLEHGRSIFVRGKIQLSQGDPQAAAADWTRALELFSSLGAVPSADKTRRQIRALSQA